MPTNFKVRSRSFILRSIPGRAPGRSQAGPSGDVLVAQCREPARPTGGARVQRGETGRGASFRSQVGVDAPAIVENEAVAVVMLATGVLEVFQDAAVELPGRQALLFQHH